MPKEKTTQIHFRTTSEEKELLIEKAKNAKMTLSEFIVSMSESKPIIIIDDVSKIIVEVSRIGNNINQIVKVANSQKFVNKEQIEKIINAYRNIVDLLDELIKKINKIIEEEYDEDEFEKPITLNEIKKELTELVNKIDRVGSNEKE